eukprot:TRINITY_DN13536_c0_g1_i2.p1 TRINITY_DN13536_c0_g1~~TRINITY_DN13536_c0_g1_i2.p1  ORF type:complete len:495 (-),score=54.18 TRINITY_DN13536_c0_g1_i2:184-1668(-)
MTDRSKQHKTLPADLNVDQSSLEMILPAKKARARIIHDEGLFQKLPEEVMLKILRMLLPNDRARLANCIPRVSPLLNQCRIWKFSRKTSLAQFKEKVEKVVKLEIRTGGSKILPGDLIDLFKSQLKLKHFSIDEFHSGKSERIDAELVACLGGSCSNLEHLSLPYCPDSGMGPRPVLLFTNQATTGSERSGQTTGTDHPDIIAGVWKSQPVFQNFLQLRTLKINSLGYEMDVIHEIFGLPNLDTLELVDAVLKLDPFKIMHLRILNDLLAPLRSLSLSCCRGVAPIFFGLLTTKLIKLDLSKSDVTTEGILDLVERSPNIEHLNLNHCTIDKYGFDALFAAYKSKLINLGIKGTNVETSNIIALSSDCENLKRSGVLDFSSCLCLTSEGINAILKSFGDHLRKFTARNCFIRDTVMLQMSDFCQEVEYIDVGGSNMSRRGILVCLQKCQKLKELRVVYNGSCHLTEAFRNEIQTLYPHIKTDLHEIGTNRLFYS